MENKIEYLSGLVNAAIPEVYAKGMSYYEVLTAVVNKLNELINKSNEYFDTDLKVYLSDLLSEMQTNGSLEQIIADTLETGLNITNNEVLNLQNTLGNQLFTEKNYITDLDPVASNLNNLDINLALKVSKDRVFIDVKDYGAIGNGIADDTAAIQSAFNTGKSVRFPQGTYLTDANLIIPSNVTVDLTGAIIKRKPNNEIGYKILDCGQSINVTIINPTLIGEKDQHLGVDGQWGHGIDSGSSENITVINPTISNCWGDGIYIGRNTGFARPKKFHVLGTANIFNCRRQGISVTSGDDIFIDTLIATDIGGSAPGAGLDVEPNSGTDFVNLTVNNLIVKNCTYGLLSIMLTEFVNFSIANIYITNCVTPILTRVDYEGVSTATSFINLGRVVIDNIKNTNPIIIQDNIIGAAPRINIDSVFISNWVIDSASSSDSWTGVIRVYLTRSSTSSNKYGNITVGTINVVRSSSNKNFRPFIVSTSIGTSGIEITNIKINHFLCENPELGTTSFSMIKMNDVSSPSPNINHYKISASIVNVSEGFNFKGYSNSVGVYQIADTFKFAQVYCLDSFINFKFMGGSLLKTIKVNGDISTPVADVIKLENTKNKTIIITQYNNEILISFENANSGTSSQRPILSGDTKGGFMFLDKTINKPIWWNGTNWIDSTGTLV